MTSPDVEIPRSAYGLAFPLAVVAGYVNAVGFLTLAVLGVLIVVDFARRA